MISNNSATSIIFIATLTSFGYCATGKTRPFDCADLQTLNGTTVNGFYQVNIPGCIIAISTVCTKTVLCDFTTNGGGWTVIQQRQTGALDFFTNQGWEAYKAGFSSGQELWLGNVYINALTNQGTTYVMLVQTTDTTGQTYTANYAGFSMSSEATFYRAALGAYTGTTLVDNFVRIQNQPFETFDRKTDQNPTTNCALFTESGWWFNPQCESVGDLNSPYVPNAAQPQILGIQWQSNNGIVRLTQTSMKIRPSTFTGTGKRK